MLSKLLQRKKEILKKKKMLGAGQRRQKHCHKTENSQNNKHAKNNNKEMNCTWESVIHHIFVLKLYWIAFWKQKLNEVIPINPSLTLIQGL